MMVPFCSFLEPAALLERVFCHGLFSWKLWEISGTMFLRNFWQAAYGNIENNFFRKLLDWLLFIVIIFA